MAPQNTPTPAVLARTSGTPYARTAWETSVLTSGAGHDERALALVLAHLADAFGELPAGGPQRAGYLSRLTRLQCQRIREALKSLEARRFLTRPDQHEWMADPIRNSLVRPITLTVPLHAPRAPRPHPGAGPE